MIVLRKQKQFGLFNFMGNFAKASKAKGLSTAFQQTAKTATEKAALAKDWAGAAGAGGHAVDAAEVTRFTNQAANATSKANKMANVAAWEKTKGIAKVGTLGAAGLAGVGAVGTGMAMNNALSGDMGQDGY